MARRPKVPVGFLFLSSWSPLSRPSGVPRAEDLCTPWAEDGAAAWFRTRRPSQVLACLDKLKPPGTENDDSSVGRSHRVHSPVLDWGCGDRHCPWHARVPAHSARARTAQALEIRGVSLPGSGGTGFAPGSAGAKCGGCGEHKKWFEAKLRRAIPLLRNLLADENAVRDQVVIFEPLFMKSIHCLERTRLRETKCLGADAGRLA